ncbi:MAG: FkbM family methyltransferase [Candidatus Melainabacteria bacterium]|nr:MAG: FkbM family methyltransferase [Candidatus Melainabacteria bacterium]
MLGDQDERRGLLRSRDWAEVNREALKSEKLESSEHWLTPDSYKQCLAEIEPFIANYNWLWKVLRWRAGLHGGMFPERAYAALKPFGNQKKPYFIGTTTAGVKFVGDYRDLYSVLLVVDPSFHLDFVKFICEKLTARRGKVFIDVGSNMGIVAASVAKLLGPDYRVIAVEPVHATATRAAATFALNSLSNVELFKGAISETNGEISFFQIPGHSDRASIHADAIERDQNLIKITVPSRTLDSIADERKLGEIGFIKFDVEGHEPSAVAGTQSIIERDKPDIIYEYAFAVAEKMGWEASDVAALIGKITPYKFFSMVDDQTLGDFPPPAKNEGLVNIYCSPE